MEKWKDIVGYEGLYQVSNQGRVRSLDRFINNSYETVRKIKGKIIIPHYRGNYLVVVLHKNGVQKSHLVHRLVAKAFLVNPDNLPQVNHKDENKTNNCVDNLEWCTVEYNINYGTAKQRISKSLLGHKMSKDAVNKRIEKISKPVIAINIENGEKLSFSSTTKAAEALNLHAQNIYAVLKGRCHHTGGYSFQRP